MFGWHLKRWVSFFLVLFCFGGEGEEIIWRTIDLLVCLRIRGD